MSNSIFLGERCDLVMLRVDTFEPVLNEINKS